MDVTRLGPYRIVGTLGQGGMGAVYEAVNEQTDERAAVKILSASMSKHEGFRQRFEAEIETLRKLRHPNIVRLFGFGEQEGLLFYAMELVEAAVSSTSCCGGGFSLGGKRPRSGSRRAGRCDTHMTGG